MATYSHGVSVSFGGAAFSEVTGLGWNYGGGMPQGRGVVWVAEAGDVTVESLGGLPVAYGAYGTLSIAGGGMNLTVNAVCTGQAAAAEVNGVTRYSTSFTILM